MKSAQIPTIPGSRGRLRALSVRTACLLTLAFWQAVWTHAEAGPGEPDAVVLLDQREFRIVNRDRAVLKVQRRIRVNREAGSRLAKVVIWENAFARCRNISGRILNANGKVFRELERSEIEKANLSPSSVLYNDVTSYTFDLRSAAYPYTIEYAYEVNHESLFFWPSWHPQEDFPVRRAVYRLVLKEDIDYAVRKVGLDIEPSAGIEKGSRILTWELADIEPMVEEPAMPPEAQEQLALHFAPKQFRVGKYPGSFATWEDFAGWYRRLTADKYTLPQEAQESIRSLVAATDDPRRKVEALYAHLQDHTRYVAIELGIGGWQPYSAASTYTNRYGDCKDLSTLMVSMLAEVGIEAYPALVLIRSGGVVARDFPSNQFNHCITFVPMDRDTLWLECTADHIAAGEIPADIAGLLTSPF